MNNVAVETSCVKITINFIGNNTSSTMIIPSCNECQTYAIFLPDSVITTSRSIEHIYYMRDSS